MQIIDLEHVPASVGYDHNDAVVDDQYICPVFVSPQKSQKNFVIAKMPAIRSNVNILSSSFLQTS